MRAHGASGPASAALASGTRPTPLVCALLLLVACAPEGDGDKPGAGGKADLYGVEEGSPEAAGILKVANEASRDLLDDEVGLDTRAADAIAEYRDGPDASPGTADDERFETLVELDDVDYVGKTAFEKLLAYAQAQGYIADTTLRIATFNIRWYGLNGDYESSMGTETRTADIAAFIDENIGDSDVFIFQEIVDVPLFEAELAAEGWACTTYSDFPPKHQYLVVCTSARYRLDPEVDDDYVYEPLNLGYLRPGVHGRIYDQELGRHVAHLMAVHLKAKPDSTSRRLQQTQVLADRLDELVALGDGLPVVFMGDFNTHWAEHTGLAQDDYRLMDELFQTQTPMTIRHVDTPFEFSFRNKENESYKLDRVWVSEGVTVVDMAMPGPCNLDWATDSAIIEDYFDRISDHCPMALTLAL